MRDVITHRGPDEAGPALRCARGARASPPEHRRSAAGQQPLVERRRHDLGDLQRRDLQPRRRCARSSRRTATSTARSSRHRDHRPRLRAVGRRLRRPLPRHVRVRDLGRAEAAPAAGARSPRHQAAVLDARRHTLLFGSEIKAILASGLVEPQANEAALPEVLSTRYIVRRRHDVPRHPQAAAGAPARLRKRHDHERQYWDVPAGRAAIQSRQPAARTATSSRGSASCSRSPSGSG